MHHEHKINWCVIEAAYSTWRAVKAFILLFFCHVRTENTSNVKLGHSKTRLSGKHHVSKDGGCKKDQQGGKEVSCCSSADQGLGDNVGVGDGYTREPQPVRHLVRKTTRKKRSGSEVQI